MHLSTYASALALLAISVIAAPVADYESTGIDVPVPEGVKLVSEFFKRNAHSTEVVAPIPGGVNLVSKFFKRDGNSNEVAAPIPEGVNSVSEFFRRGEYGADDMA